MNKNGKHRLESLFMETAVGFVVRQDDELWDQGDPCSRLMMTEEREQLGGALRSLGRREQGILRRHYGLDREPESLERIAKAYKVTKPCIAKREKVALARIRSLIETKKL